MRITYQGHDFELGNEIAMEAASRERAREMISQVERKDIEAVLESVLTQLVGYWLKLGATVRQAHAMGAAGITLEQAVDMHNYIASVIGEPHVSIVPEPSPLVDAQGNPAPPPGQPPTVGDEA